MEMRVTDYLRGAARKYQDELLDLAANVLEECEEEIRNLKKQLEARNESILYRGPEG